MGFMKDLMYNNNSRSTTTKGNNRTVIFPKTITNIDNKCNNCNNKLINWSENHKDKIHECRNCRSDWWSNNCDCTYEEYICDYYLCLKCIETNRCKKCKILILTHKCHDYPNVINYVKSYDNKTCQSCNLCLDCSSKNNNHYCDSCFFKCIECKKQWNNYNKSYGDKEEIINNKCKQCLQKCNECNEYINNISDIILHENKQICINCYDKNYNPTDNNSIYKMIKQETNMFSIFIEWQLIKQSKQCKKCNIKYLFVLEPFFAKPKWQRVDVSYLKNCCESCYNRRYNKKLEKFKLTNPNPSDNCYNYVLDEYNFKWEKENFINYCKKCNNQIIIPIYHEKQKNEFKFCCNCNPSNGFVKYKWSDNNWEIKLVKILDNKKHKWFKPCYNSNYNENYVCECDKCNKI
jgi:hypothetical protein